MTATKMNYHPLGNTGVKVSELCLGAMSFSKEGKGGFGMPAANETDSHKIINAFVERGGNFIDTADLYPGSEEVVGKWLVHQQREKFIIATKVGFGAGGVNDAGLNRRHMLEAVDTSLKYLQTSYIDLYQAHIWDSAAPIEDTFRTFNDLVRSGKVRYIGVSNYTGAQLQKVVDLTKYNGLERVVCLQPQYNLLQRNIEWELVKICQGEGIGIIPWSPLASGLLTGKHKDKPQTDSRVELLEKMKHPLNPFEKNNNEKTANLYSVIESIVKENNMTFPQVALRWVMQKPGITAPIIGSRTVEQLNDNMGVLEKVLTPEQMKRLDDASAAPSPYPWTFV